VAVRFGSSSRVKARLPRYSNFWDGTAVYNPFTPTGSYDALATYTVPSGGVSSITFAGLPTGGQYTHLQIRYTARSTRAATDTQVNMRFNDATSTYPAHIVYGDGSGAYASAYTSNSFIQMNDIPAANATSGIFNATIVDILDYANTNKYKTVRSLIGRDLNGSGLILLHSGLYQSTTAISSINIYPAADNFAQYSQFALYGVKG
jgi:hypothetical protein